jgi:hypothetical protein
MGEEGINAQRAWLNEHFPGAQVKFQLLLLGPPVLDVHWNLLASGISQGLDSFV